MFVSRLPSDDSTNKFMLCSRVSPTGCAALTEHDWDINAADDTNIVPRAFLLEQELVALGLEDEVDGSGTKL